VSAIQLTCGHQTSPVAVLPVWPATGGAFASDTAIRLELCRVCVLGLTGYPTELTAALDKAFTEKQFGVLEMTLQSGVPGTVYFRNALKVASWSPWPRTNWIMKAEPGEGV